jgi:hypothetical protein
VFALGFIAKTITEPSITWNLAYSIGGIIALLLWVYLMQYYFVETRVYWNEDRAVLTVIRPWSVEVSAARKMDSVPLGIDLTHSASKVLRALHGRLSDGPESGVSFFVSRPISDGRTCVGMVVSRSAFNLVGAQRTVTRLVKQISVDVQILESSMRAAYPHLPVAAVTREEIVKACSGGSETAK